MNTKMKTLLFGLLFAVTCGLKAQEQVQYEAAILTYSNGGVNVIYANSPVENVPFEKGNAIAGFLKKLEVMLGEGWEIEVALPSMYNGGTVSEKYILKRKKK